VASLGFGVARPHGDSERYDFILDSGERFRRVQVTSIFGLVEGIYRLRGAHGDKIPYTAEEIDFLVAYIAAENLWYVVPVDCVPASAVLAFYPSGRERGSSYFEAFREAWHLMAREQICPSLGYRAAPVQISIISVSLNSQTSPGIGSLRQSEPYF
jgi:PD-(D/E)XK endonuclease